MWNLARLFFASWYLWGWLAHLILGVSQPEIYAAFGTTALSPVMRELWARVVMPNIGFFTVILAAFELVVGWLLMGRGWQVKAGIAASVTFNLFLVQLGLGYPAPDAWADFTVNRLPNLLFAAGQLTLLRREFDRPILQVLRRG